MGISSLRSSKMISRCTKTNTQISLSKNPCRHCMKKEEELEEQRGRTWGEKNFKLERKGKEQQMFGLLLLLTAYMLVTTC